MDGTLLTIAGAVATPCAAGIAWLAKKTWTMLENHMERRTKAFEAVAPAIKATFDDIRSHVTSHADEQAKAVEKAEQTIVKAVHEARADIVDKIGISARLERLEAAAFKAKEPEDPTLLERSETRPSQSSVQPIRESRPALARR